MVRTDASRRGPNGTRLNRPLTAACPGRVIGTDFLNNNTRDLTDENPNCATNVGFANDFKLADSACIQ